MNDWPVDAELDSKLRRLVNAELASAAGGGPVRRRTRGRNDRTVAGIGVVAAIALVATLALRTQVGSGPGPASSGSLRPSPTPAGPPSASYVPGAKMLCGANDMVVVTLADGRALALAGRCPAGTPAELFDPRTSAFSRTGVPVTDHTNGSATLLTDGRVLLAGGSDATAEVYDPRAGAFTPIGPMTTARTQACVARLQDGRVLIAGGDYDRTGKFGSAEIFDPAAGVFSPTGSMTTAHSGYKCSALLLDGRVLIVGGVLGEANTAEIYDPTTQRFTTTGPMAVRRDGRFAAITLASGKVLVVGGEPTGAQTGTAELFDPGTDTFQPTGSTSRIHDVFAAARLDDGRVLIVGPDAAEPLPPVGVDDGLYLASSRSEGVPARPGVDGVTSSWIVCETYDPTTGTFSRDGTLKIPRSYFSASLLADGRLLVVGGQTDTAELFDPATGESTIVGS
jgi:large repetitive protein